jgi:hypothetical protein
MAALEAATHRARVRERQSLHRSPDSQWKLCRPRPIREALQTESSTAWDGELHLLQEKNQISLTGCEIHKRELCQIPQPISFGFRWKGSSQNACHILNRRVIL